MVDHHLNRGSIKNKKKYFDFSVLKTKRGHRSSDQGTPPPPLRISIWSTLMVVHFAPIFRYLFFELSYHSGFLLCSFVRTILFPIHDLFSISIYKNIIFWLFFLVFVVIIIIIIDANIDKYAHISCRHVQNIIIWTNFSYEDSTICYKHKVG